MEPEAHCLAARGPLPCNTSVRCFPLPNVMQPEVTQLERRRSKMLKMDPFPTPLGCDYRLTTPNITYRSVLSCNWQSSFLFPLASLLSSSLLFSPLFPPSSLPFPPFSPPPTLSSVLPPSLLLAVPQSAPLQPAVRYHVAGYGTRSPRLATPHPVARSPLPCALLPRASLSVTCRAARVVRCLAPLGPATLCPAPRCPQPVARCRAGRCLYPAACTPPPSAMQPEFTQLRGTKI